MTIKNMCAAAGAVLVSAGCLIPREAPAETRPSMRLACQLWSVKDLWSGNPDKLAAFAEVFPKLKAMGYDGVQSAAFLEVDPAGLEKLLAENGLSVADQPVRRMEDLEDESSLARVAAFCRRFGVDFVYVPWFKSETIEGWKGLCRRLDAAEAKLKEGGIRVGYHNHLRELAEPKEGVYPWSVLVSGSGARLEMDIGPVLESGHSPEDELLKMAGRLPGGIHAKPVGASAAGAEGDRQNWPGIVAAAVKAGAKWLVVECEQRQDTYEDVAASAKFLKPLVSAGGVPESGRLPILKERKERE